MLRSGIDRVPGSACGIFGGQCGAGTRFALSTVFSIISLVHNIYLSITDANFQFKALSNNPTKSVFICFGFTATDAAKFSCSWRL
jgi:hypothetical protein